MTTDIYFGLFGAGGFGREVMPWARDFFADKQEITTDFFIEDKPKSSVVNGVQATTLESFVSLEGLKKYFNVAISHSASRERIATKLIALGLEPISLVSNSAIVQSSSTIGDGAIVCPNAMVTANIHIGDFFHANIYSYVGHDCVIGNYVTFAPGAKCNGNVVVEDHAYIGSGAMIRQGTPDKPLTIGKGAIVGMGAVVTKDVEPFTTVVGNPARPLK